MGHLIAIGGLALACAGWVLLQRYIQRVAPGVEPLFLRECGGHGGCGSCESSCAERAEPPPG